MLLGGAALAALPGCDDGPIVPGAPSGAGPSVVVASPSTDGVTFGLTLARSSDGSTFAAGWSELAEKETLQVATSTDGGATFAEAVQVDDPDEEELSYLRLLLPDGAGLLAGAVAHVPDPMEPSPHSWPRVYQAKDPGAAFELSSDLQSVLGERSFIQGAFAASDDGKTVVWAWVDTTPPDWLEPDAAPTQALLASISTDSGETFGEPQVVSATPFTNATRIAAFVRDGRAGVVYAEARTIAGVPVPVGVAALAMADDDGTFQAPVMVATDEYGAVPAGGAVGAEGAAPGAALGPDGSIHVAWWSAITIGLWYAVSADGETFSDPVEVFASEGPTPANVRVAVDGTGAAWIAALDQGTVRVVQVPAGGEPTEVGGAADPLGGTGDAFDVAGLPDGGAAQLWLGAPPEDETEPTSLPILFRLIVP